MCCVSYTKNGVKYMVFRVAYTLVEIAVTEQALNYSEPEIIWFKIIWGLKTFVTKFFGNKIFLHHFFTTFILMKKKNSNKYLFESVSSWI